MSAALPIADPCCIESCDDVLVQNVPGPAGTNGTNGAAGANGVSAVTTLTVAFTMPAELASDTATVGSTAGRTIGETVYVQGLGTLQVTAIASATGMTLKNLEDAATFAYASNAAAGTVAAIGSRVSATGMQGAAGLLGGAVAGGQLKGTYPNPTLLIPNALGALTVGNGTDAVSLSMGVAGYLPVNDPATFPATGIGHKRVVPIGGDTNAAADRLVRLSASTGVPIPIEVSRASLKDPGGLGLFVVDDTTGNARGTDSVDLQVSRSAGVQVASGARSFIGGGQNNTAAGTECVVTGGEDNTAGAVGQNHSIVAGGSGNSATGQESFVGGGQDNIASNTQGVVVGGDTNICDAEEGFIGGGRSNLEHGPNGAIVGGLSNVIEASTANGFIGSGLSNNINGDYSVVVGGERNVTSEDYTAIPGGKDASADKYGQRAFSAGQFAASGDCQQTDLMWRLSTTDNTPAVEMYLNGAAATKRATVPANKTWAFDLLIVGRSSAGASAAWTVKGVVQNNAGTTAIVGAVTNALLADGTGGTWGTLANIPVVTADDTNDSLRIRVTGSVATLIRWAATARIMEVGY